MIDLNGIDLLILIGRDTQLKRTAATHGGEYAGPCPLCGGRDRFRVWPSHPDGKGRWWCRGCEKHGDALDYVRECDGLTFLDALGVLGLSAQAGLDAGDNVTSPRPSPRPRPPRAQAAPGSAWQERGRAFVEECKAALCAPGGARALNWLRGRGLSDETIESAVLGYNATDSTEGWATWGLEPREGKRGVWLPRGIVIPWIIGADLWRVNIRRPVGDPKYIGPAGWANGLYNAEALTTDMPAMMVEGELDALTLTQEIGDLVTSVATGSTGGSRRARWIARLALCPAVLVAFDMDAPGEKGAAYWVDVLDNAQRWRPYWGDANEMASDGADLRGWVSAALRGRQRTETPTPPAVVTLPIPQEAPRDAESAEPDEIPRNLAGNGPQDVADLPGHRGLVACLALDRELPDADLIGDIETAMEAHLAEMEVATGCPDAEAGRLLAEFDRLTAAMADPLPHRVGDGVYQESFL